MPHLFPPTRGEQRWRALGYMFVALAGFYIMWDTLDGDPDTALVFRLNDYAKIIWSVFMLTALPAAWCSLRGTYQVESILLPLFGSALLVGCFNGALRIIFQHEWDITTRVLYGMGLLCLLAVRGLQLHRIVKGDGPWRTSTSGG